MHDDDLKSRFARFLHRNLPRPKCDAAAGVRRRHIIALTIDSLQTDRRRNDSANVFSACRLFQDGEEVSRLKETIRKLRAGGHHDEDDHKEDGDG